jgi:beta-lactamase superfamily II metal-dependent hydrolase
VLEAGGNKMLVTGEDEDERLKELQTALVGRLPNGHLYPIDVYIVGPYGSEMSNGLELQSLINPTFALISSHGPGGRYGKPTITVVERFSVGATLLSSYQPIRRHSDRNWEKRPQTFVDRH